MGIQISVVIIAILIFLFVVMVLKTKRKEIEVKYVIPWFFSEILLLIFVLIPVVINKIAVLMGVRDGANIVFFLGFIFISYIIWTITLASSNNSVKIRRLNQEIALLKKEIEELKNE